MPALVIGSVFPPMPFNVTIGIPYCLHSLIEVKNLGCAKDTEPQESNLTSQIVFTKEPSSFLCLNLNLALQISGEPGEIKRCSEMNKCRLSV